MAAVHRPSRRFRRRLLAVLLAAGLLPLVAWGLLGNALVKQTLSLSPPLGTVLARASQAPALAQPFAEELRQARLHLAQAELARRALVRRAPLLLGAALVASALFLTIAAWLLGRSLARPLERLTEAMARFERGELEHQIPEPPGRADELALAVRQFNRMGRELMAQRLRLRESERIAAWHEVARTLAHELKNPLTAMKMALARLRRPAPTQEATSEALALLDEEIDLLLRMARSFAELARLPTAAPRLLDLATLVEEVCTVYGAVVVRTPARPTVLADADQLRRALGNLVKNALEAGGPVAVEVTAQGAEAEVVVLDRGPGIPTALEGDALGRGLASTKADGSGLGLPIAHRIVHEHRGRLRLEPDALGGTRAVVRLPLAVGVAS